MKLSVIITALAALTVFSGAQGTMLKKGDEAPEISATNPEGKTMKLSDYRGKIVLIDFWASWCGPCRIANPHLVRIYNKYKDSKFYTGEQGFTIFSVSLDAPNGREAWINAIKKDGLIWNGHVSDLRGWSSGPAAVYGVDRIPQGFLVDGNGTIIGRFFHPDDIDFILSRRLKEGQ